MTDFIYWWKNCEVGSAELLYGIWFTNVYKEGPLEYIANEPSYPERGILLYKMSLVGRALVADSESDWSLESPLLANVVACPDSELGWSVKSPELGRSLKSPLLTNVVACPDSESEIKQSDGAALPAPQAESQPRQGCQRPGEQPKGGDHWEIWIQNEKDQIRQLGHIDCTILPPVGVSIFKVPSFLKVSTKNQAYVPQVVSFGPYHHRRAKLKPMEIHKERALHRMVKRFDDNNPNNPNNPKKDFFQDFVGIFQEKDDIMNSYEEKYHSKPKYLAMMVRDGCFILEILMTLRGDKFLGDVSNCYEPIFDVGKIENTGFDILNDMLKLENQIPLIVLQRLLELVNKKNDDGQLLASLIISIVPRFLPFNFPDEQFNHLLSMWKNLIVYSPQKLTAVSPPECRHLLGLLHSLIVFLEPDEKKGQQQVDTNKVKFYGRIPCAVELKKAGIKFQKSNSGGIANIKFEKNTIYLPEITITDHTELLFRNLVALELCKRYKINYVVCYVILMDELINSGEDVAVLTKNEIVTHYLGSDEQVANLFNSLGTAVNLSTEDVKHLQVLKQDVNKHYHDKKKVQLAQFVNDNFSSPWKALALAGAVVALVLTFVQTIFAILAVIM